MSRYPGKTHDDYECDLCGACCLHLGIGITLEDKHREPLISLHLVETNDGREWLGLPEEAGCPLLSEHGSCNIYQTKPDCCSFFQAGSLLCQWSRGRAELGTLAPKT